MEMKLIKLWYFIDFDNDGLLTASDLGRLIDDLTCAAENTSKLPPEERDAVVGYVWISIFYN